MPRPRAPQILAHRGALRDAPENTIPAVVRALELGADGIEIDVQLSRDEHLVVIHDADLERTTNGRGAVAALTAAELAGLDAGSWFDPRYEGVGVPTLSDVLDLVDDRCRVNVELKSRGEAGEHAAEVLARLLRDHPARDHVIVSCFEWTPLLRLRKLDATVALGALHVDPLSGEQQQALLASALRPQAVHPHADAVTADSMRWARSHGFAVNVWTVNDVGAARQLQELGVDAIITDAPAALITGLGEASEGRPPARMRH